MMSESPASLQLRLMQTMVEVAAEKNSTLVLPFPVELLRYLEATTDEVVSRSGQVPLPRAGDPSEGTQEELPDEVPEELPEGVPDGSTNSSTNGSTDGAPAPATT